MNLNESLRTASHILEQRGKCQESGCPLFSKEPVNEYMQEILQYIHLMAVAVVAMQEQEPEKVGIESEYAQAKEPRLWQPMTQLLRFYRLMAEDRTSEEQKLSGLLHQLKDKHRQKPTELEYDNAYMPCPTRKASEVILRSLDTMLNPKIAEPYVNFLFELDEFAKEETLWLMSQFASSNGGVAEQSGELVPT